MIDKNRPEMFEYVASGLSFSRLNLKNVHDPEHRDYTNLVYKLLRQKNGHEFSFLFNAFQEKNFGEWFSYYKEYGGVKNIYTDSGGLQMITKGKTITQKEKNAVYNVQGKWSQFAMCFDEIPVSYVGERSERNNEGNRWFDREKFEECARQTGRNIRDQIDTFQKLGSDAKPIFIAQGNDLETYKQWTELALEEMPKDYHELIGSIAMGAASLGSGTLEDIQRMFYYTQIRKYFPKGGNHLHLLGVGAATRLLPVIIFMQSGLLDNVWVSYDSTSHTMGVQMGRYFLPDGTILDHGRDLDEDYERVYEDIEKNVPIYKCDIETFHNALNISAGGYNEKYSSFKPAFQTFSSYIVSSIINFTKQIDRLYNSKDEVMKHLNDGSKEYNAFRLLYDVKTPKDFVEWERTVHSSIASKPIRSEQSTLEGLFV